MPIKDCNGDVIGVAQVINKLGGEGQFTAQDEKVFASYLQFCGIGLRNAQLYEQSQLEVKRNQVQKHRSSVHFFSEKKKKRSEEDDNFLNRLF